MSILPVEDFVRPQLDPQSNAKRFEDAAALLAQASHVPDLVGGFPSFAPHLLDEGHSGYSEQEIDAMERDQASSFYWSARNELIGWLVKRHFPDARRVLDVGCGTGYVTACLAEALPEARLYASDTSIQGLRTASRNLGGRAFLAHLDALDLPFEETFDLITTFDVLEHIEDDQAVLNQTYKALRPGGGVLHFVPQHPSMYSPADQASRHFRRYGCDELQSKLVKAGFEVTYTSSFIFGLFPLFVISRLKSKMLGRHSHEAEHAQAGWVGGVLAALQKLEFSLLKKGLRYPVGVSRAVVAFRAS